MSDVRLVWVGPRGRRYAVRGREPWLGAAVALLSESGCTVRRWRKTNTGVARIRSDDWGIEVPEPRGAVSYVTLAHEVGHQMLHRPGLGRRTERWLEEIEAWEYALATFDRFGLPDLARAEADAEKALNRNIQKALARSRDKAALAARIIERAPGWEFTFEQYGLEAAVEVGAL